MFDKIHYYYFNANYEKCLNLSEQFLKESPKFALEFATLSSYKLSLFQKALYYAQELFSLNPTSFNGLMLAKSYIENLRLDEALNLLQTLLTRKDDLEDELKLELAFIYKLSNKLEESEQIFKELLSKDMYNLNLWKNYAEIYFKHDFTKALNAHEHLCHFMQDLIDKLQKGIIAEQTNLNLVKLEDRLHSKTKENLTISKIEDFLTHQILPQKAYLLFKLFRISDSLELFQSLQEANQHHAQFWQNYAKVLEFNSNYQEAYHAYKKCLSLDSHATYQFDLAYLLMRMGVDDNFEEGKKYYESRLFYAHNETFSTYHYNESLKAFNKFGIDAFKNKEVLVFCEQGFGDTIMYARCLEKLCKIASKVLFAPQSAMYEMFKNQIKFLNQNDDIFKNVKVLKNLPTNFDYAIPICSLPFFIDIKLDEILRLKTPILPQKKPHNQRKKLGIFYATPNAENSDLLRNVKFEFLFDVLKDLDYEIISFQMQLKEELPKVIEDRSKLIKNWNDTLNYLYDIDCMLSIDSAIAHLSLAMDIPTIVLLHPRFDWRWGKFENPKSYFWPKAKCFIIKEQEETKRNLQKLIKDILN
ncbi:hypothetical protein QNQ85_001449 [Campylobacter jejuni]|nr:hypothetical protein [Campylobacter jejuni]ELU0913726.1 hypothetical protein [Campylobacter jejuni]